MISRLICSLSLIFVLSTVLAAVGCGPTSIPTPYVAEKFQICTNGCHDPAISGETVVWIEHRYNDDNLFAYNLSTQIEFPICLYTFRPYPLGSNYIISGDIVVWEDDRNNVLFDDTGNCCEPYNIDIYGFNLSSLREFSICTNLNVQGFPAISGNTIIWTDGRNGNWTCCGQSTNLSIYGYNLSSHKEFPIYTNQNLESRSLISGNTMIFSVDNISTRDIYGYNISTQTAFFIRTMQPGDQSEVFSEHILVWQDGRNDYIDNNGAYISKSAIYCYDILTKREFPICTDPAAQNNPAISGDIVVWQDGRNGTWDIYGYNIETQTEFPICTDPGEQVYPAISGNIVVWQDWRNNTTSIYGARLTFDNK
jgi:beta propeller repeat protein